MRLVSTSLLVVALAVAVVGCGGSKASSNSAAASGNAASAAPAGGDAPLYPGATVDTTDLSINGGKVYATADSIDKVYAWYHQNMPAGSEQVHTATFDEWSTATQMVALHILPGKTTIGISPMK